MEREESKRDMEIRLRKAGYDDVDPIKKLLAKAFDEDPYANWMVLQDKKRIQRLEISFEVAAKHYALQYEHVFTTENLGGVIMWFPPEPRDCWNSSNLKDLTVAHKIISATGFRQFLSRLYGYGVIKKHHLKEPHYYLNIIGVDPTYQGKGIGSHLIQHGLRMCNERGLPAYLECATEDNLRFYQRHGFKVREDFMLPKGPKIWTMIYEP